MSENSDRYRQRQPRNYKRKKAGVPYNDRSTILTVVIIVSLLLLIIWFVTSRFISVMGGSSYDNQPGIEASQEETEVASEASEISSQGGVEDNSTYDMGAEENQSEEDVSMPEPLTEGAGDYNEPKSWVGKTFQVNARSNVRSGAGTASQILDVANPGDKIKVREAQMESDAVWCHGQIIRENGAVIEGWIYGWSLDANPVEE